MRWRKTQIKDKKAFFLSAALSKGFNFWKNVTTKSEFIKDRPLSGLLVLPNVGNIQRGNKFIAQKLAVA